MKDPAEDEGLEDAETREAQEVAGRGDSNHVKSEDKRDEAVTNLFAPRVTEECPRSVLALESSSLRRFIVLWELGVVLRYPRMCSCPSHFAEQDDVDLTKHKNIMNNNSKKTEFLMNAILELAYSGMPECLLIYLFIFLNGM